MNLQLGDIACTRNPENLGRLINKVQAFYASDNASTYGHALVITSRAGETFEARSTLRHYHLNTYVGDQVLIGRNKNMTNEKFLSGYDAIFDLDGRKYPKRRLLLHLFPPFARINWFGNYVCSGVVDLFLKSSGLSDPVTGGEYNFRGRNPDHIADMIHRWNDWEVVFEGVWDGD